MGLVWTIINLIVLFLLLRHFLINPVSNIMEQRRKLIADGEIGNVLSFQTSFQHSGPESWSVDAGKNNVVLSKESGSHGRDGGSWDS